MCIVLEPKNNKILQKEKTSVDSIVVYIVLTWKVSNEEQVPLSSRVKTTCNERSSHGYRCFGPGH